MGSSTLPLLLPSFSTWNKKVAKLLQHLMKNRRDDRSVFASLSGTSYVALCGDFVYFLFLFFPFFPSPSDRGWHPCVPVEERMKEYREGKGRMERKKREGKSKKGKRQIPPLGPDFWTAAWTAHCDLPPSDCQCACLPSRPLCEHKFRAYFQTTAHF